ncbi:MAG: hypothetical protein H6672_16690 [Anaerolineaceae bacterium]|nr:hypothetical protein [Anaerolineaceae bacterium]
MSISLNVLKKIRGRLLRQTSGMPVAGVVVTLSVAIEENSHVPISTLKSDSTGYFSFDLQALINMGLNTVSGLYISAPQVGLANHNLLRTLLASTSHEQALLARYNDAERTDTRGEQSLCIEFPIYVEDSNVCSDVANALCQTANIPSIQSPDGCDYKLSPYSFVTSTKLNLGEDCCESLVPSTLPIQEHLFYRVIVRRGGEGDLDTVDASLERSVDITKDLDKSPLRVKFADVLDYRQRWYAIGHSLGEIKYSLPLAPGESTQLAVIEWSRNDAASRFDSVTAKENLVHWQNRDRTIEETIDAGLKESQGGWSWAGGLSSGMAYDAKEYGQYTGNWAAGGGTKNSWGNRNLEADSLQELHDTITQSTSYTRSLNSTVIVQASQAEMNNVQTRRVANHNHCHALTVQYYEVLRHFRLCTEFVGRRQAVLIPFSTVTFATREIAIRFRTILEQALLNQSLLPFFDALVRLEIDIYPDETGDPGDSTDPTYFTGSLSGQLVDARHFPMFPVSGGNRLLIEKGSTLHITAEMVGNIINFGGGSAGNSDVDGQPGNPAPENQNWPMPGVPSFAFLAKVGSEFHLVQRDYTFEAKEEGELSFWFNDGGPLTDNNGFAMATVTVSAPTSTEPPGTVKDLTDSLSPKNADEVKEKMLLKHLNANIGYYNRAIWFLLDSVERQIYLEMALGYDSDLLAAIDTRPIAVSGNYVAFIYDGPLPSDRDEVVELETKESIVTLPTRGLFAEAQLGHCNSCEQRDITRMWDWTVMTTEEPPAITGIEPGPQGQTPNITPAQLPSNVIQIAPTPAAPDPAGLAAALKLLGTPDIFRDMSGLDEASMILGKLVDGTNTTLAEMVKGAAAAKQKVDATRTQSGTSSNRQSQKQTPAERYDNLQVAKEVAKAADELGLNDQQKSDLTQDIIGSGVLWQFPKTIPNTGQAGSTTTSWPNLDRVKVLERLKLLQGNANLFDQGPIGLCTAAAFYHHIIQRDPLQFYLFGSGLLSLGVAFLGNLKVVPGDDLRGADYNGLAKRYANFPPQADWMLMSALRDSENWLFDFEGSPDENIAMLTSAREMSEWYTQTGFYQSVSYSTDTSRQDISKIQKKANNHIALWISVKLLGDPRDGTHMITLESPITIDVANNKVTFDYWTWAQPVKTLATTVDALEANYMGSIVATF